MAEGNNLPTETVKKTSQGLDNFLKKNQSAIKLGVAFGLVFAVFSILNITIPFLVCLTIFIVWALKLFAGITLANVMSVNADKMFKADSLSAIAIYSIISALIEGIIGGIFTLIWQSITFQSTFLLWTSIASSIIIVLSLIVGNLIFTIVGVVLHVYLYESYLKKPLAGLIKLVRNTLKI